MLDYFFVILYNIYGLGSNSFSNSPEPKDSIGINASEKECIIGRRMRMSRVFSYIIKKAKFKISYTIKTPLINFTLAPLNIFTHT